MSHQMKASALKHCGKTHRRESYPTPVPVARLGVKQAADTALHVKHVIYGKRVVDQTIRILDVCAGNGVWGIAMKQRLEALGYSVHLTAVEIDRTILPAPEVDRWVTADFRDIDSTEIYDFILSNPPFSLVYELTAWSIKHLTPYGLFTLLIGSNYMFAQTLIDKWLQDVVPLFEMKLTRRPSFIQLYSKMAYGIERRGTNAKDYCIYYFGGDQLSGMRHMDDVSVRLALPAGSTLWPTWTQYWDYDPSDPLERLLQERPVSVQQALIREAAEAPEGTMTWDDDYSLYTVNVYGWEFYHADSDTRLSMMASICLPELYESSMT